MSAIVLLNLNLVSLSVLQPYLIHTHHVSPALAMWISVGVYSLLFFIITVRMIRRYKKRLADEMMTGYRSLNGYGKHEEWNRHVRRMRQDLELFDKHLRGQTQHTSRMPFAIRLLWYVSGYSFKRPLHTRINWSRAFYPKRSVGLSSSAFIRDTQYRQSENGLRATNIPEAVDMTRASDAYVTSFYERLGEYKAQGAQDMFPLDEQDRANRLMVYPHRTNTIELVLLTMDNYVIGVTHNHVRYESAHVNTQDNRRVYHMQRSELLRHFSGLREHMIYQVPIVNVHSTGKPSRDELRRTLGHLGLGDTPHNRRLLMAYVEAGITHLWVYTRVFDEHYITFKTWVSHVTQQASLSELYLYREALYGELRLLFTNEPTP